MQLDHFVVHVDNDIKPLENLASTISEVGFPFRPRKGKGTSGFKASNIWVGDQYFEIVRLLKPDGGGWPGEWVERFNRGERGISCIFLRTEDLDSLFNRLLKADVPCSIEKTRFKVFFGLMTMEMPWRYIKMTPIPGTHLDIRFIQYDASSWDHYRKYMKPNAREFGVDGIWEAQVNVPSMAAAKPYIATLFPEAEFCENSALIKLRPGKISFVESSQDGTAILFAKAKDPKNKSWNLLDLEVRV